MNEIDRIFLLNCIKQIEEKYFPNSTDIKLRQRDFEYLLDLIEEKSGIKLSISTIKRIWGIEKKDQNPHPSTLDGLVSLLDCKDWLDFKLRNTDKENNGKINSISKKLANKVKFSLAIVLVLFVTIVLFLLQKNTPKNSLTPENIKFSVNKTVSRGVPNTVIFNYDVSDISADSFFIQQDWNPNHRDRINPQGEYFSSIFYMPGFHKTKLIANETILEIIPVHIQSDGWLSMALYNYDDQPVYLTKDTDEDGVLTSDGEDITSSNVDLERFSELSFINIREFDDLDGHNFSLETRLRYKRFINDPCPTATVTVHTEAHIYYVPLTIKGCESNLNLKIGEVYKSGKDSDLSAFGSDIYEWQNIRLTVLEKTGLVYVNDELVLEVSFKDDFGKVVGIDYKFSGLGEVDFLILKDISGSIVYEESF